MSTYLSEIIRNNLSDLEFGSIFSNQVKTYGLWILWICRTYLGLGSHLDPPGRSDALVRQRGAGRPGGRLGGAAADAAPGHAFLSEVAPRAEALGSEVPGRMWPSKGKS